MKLNAVNALLFLLLICELAACDLTFYQRAVSTTRSNGDHTEGK